MSWSGDAENKDNFNLQNRRVGSINSLSNEKELELFCKKNYSVRLNGGAGKKALAFGEKI